MDSPCPELDWVEGLFSTTDRAFELGTLLKQPGIANAICGCPSMDRNAKPITPLTRAQTAFTLVEVLVAMGIVGVLAVALYSGMTSATFSIRLARENLRATEIMVEKAEGLRLFTWEQLTDPTFVPTNFTAVYYDNGTTNKANCGITYTGSFQISKNQLRTSRTP